MCIFQRAKNIAKLICFPALKVKGRSWSQNLGLKKWTTSRNSIISPELNWTGSCQKRFAYNKQKCRTRFFQCYGVYNTLGSDCRIRIRIHNNHWQDSDPTTGLDHGEWNNTRTKAKFKLSLKPNLFVTIYFPILKIVVPGYKTSEPKLLLLRLSSY